jgi:hypothetical protein
MNKRLIIAFLAGWLLALVLPPSRLLGMFRPSS